MKTNDKKDDLIKQLIEALELHKLFWDEMPKGQLGEPRFSFHPNEYGGNYKKKTLLWGKFNTPNPILFAESKVTHKNYIATVTGKNRGEIRAMTPPGFAKAFFEANR